MYILCDTSCTLMLIRIAPDMFVDASYQCCTIVKTRHEIFRNVRFKTKYPWRSQYRDKIRTLPNDLVGNESANRYFDAITVLVDHGTINEKAGCEFDLSYIDRKILACVLSNGYWLTSGDNDLKDFALQQFSREFKGSISPLAMVNRWIREGLIKWNDERHSYIADWSRDNEHPQFMHQIRQFQRLTRRPYPGS
jgi:hypothetical protein